MGTENRNTRSQHIDKMEPLEIVSLMNDEELIVHEVLRSVENHIAKAARAVADACKKDKKIVYIGSGTSGRIAALDVLEIEKSFGVQPHRFYVLQAGYGERDLSIMDPEEDEHAAIVDLNNLHLDREDIVIAVTASGRTPYTLAALRHANQKGIWTIGIANNEKSPLLEEANLGILLNTGPEVLTGLTSLKAGTAQKLVLNRINTIAMILCQKVRQNYVIDANVTNTKVKERYVKILRELSTITEDEAYQLLLKHQWNMRQVLSILEAQKKLLK